MTATDDLRRLLDERGVEWEDHSGSIEQRTVYRTPNGWCYVSTANDKWLSYVEYHDMTPSQAIDATLGAEDAYTREDVEGAFVSGYSLGSLPVGSDPQWDQNEQTVDEHMAELGWVRKDAATLGRGTCHAVFEVDAMSEDDRIGEFVCSECGETFGDGRDRVPRYCPNCGRKVVE